MSKPANHISNHGVWVPHMPRPFGSPMSKAGANNVTPVANMVKPNVSGGANMNPGQKRQRKPAY